MTYGGDHLCRSIPSFSFSIICKSPSDPRRQTSRLHAGHTPPAASVVLTLRIAVGKQPRQSSAHPNPNAIPARLCQLISPVQGHHTHTLCPELGEQNLVWTAKPCLLELDNSYLIQSFFAALVSCRCSSPICSGLRKTKTVGIW